jgi:hypothetical protein
MVNPVTREVLRMRLVLALSAGASSADRLVARLASDLVCAKMFRDSSFNLEPRKGVSSPDDV